MKYRSAWAAVAVSLLCYAVGGQTDRTTKTAATPQPQINYSESLPYSPRVFRVKEDAKKKDKKSTKEPLPVDSQLSIPGNVTAENNPMTLQVSVLNLQGKSVTDLTKPDFKLFVDSEEIAITTVETKAQPINFIFLIDVSPSTGQQSKMVRDHALRVLEQLGPDDKAMVVIFDGEMRLLCDLTADRKIIEKSLRDAKGSGDGTAIYDAVELLFEKYVPSIDGRKAILVFSDGVDTSSRKARYSTSLGAAEKAAVGIYPVYLNTLEDLINSSAWGRRMSPQLPDALLAALMSSLGLTSPQSRKEMAVKYEVGKAYLNDLVFLSGGRATAVQNFSKGASLMSNIPAEIRSQYVLTFTPLGNSFIGQRKQLKVRVNRPNLAVLARGSYIVGPGP